MQLIHPRNLGRATNAIESGKIVAVPTKRWYMLCCDATNTAATERIFAAKRRPRDKGLLLALRSREHVERYFEMNSEAQVLGSAFWPGDLALLLSWRDPLEAARHVGLGTQTCMVSNPSGILGELVNRTEGLVAATTANISVGRNSSYSDPAITIDEVRRFAETTGMAIEVLVDGGICPSPKPLTVVDCLTGRVEITRSGAIHSRAIAAALGRNVQLR